ncbi:MAG: cupin domain-containing protein [Nitrospinota bacterium]|jgi:quercetin dioxygenase-like cupin family protein|nr:cupin domain-containing protein [Nitrospinota bacterium]MDP7169596.1 cupin domain-containing protein [Nitrospinota bacterium]MDP7371445.1 cupin domain-containing protein [Nitrospinota bacterium]MDP7503577.1 cupin domain-containing protein [Nitrospinota bacterium]MDP7663545.1 cupin domain-containing protein [Nitrospinota bacterium]|tara:strand:- start:863 stop:1192 length:330 start_codon:yes stop_codon:yes gene_type:complete
MGFVDLNAMEFEVKEGTNRKVLQGSNMTMQFFDRELNVVQEHSHPQEQVVYLLEGRLKVTLEGEGTREVEAGNAVQIPGGLPHRIETLTQVKVVSVYSPARDLSVPSQP